MRVGVLIRGWLLALFGFMAVTTAFCVALVVAITGPPSWAELRGVGENVGAIFSQVGAFAGRQIEAYNDAREVEAPAPASEPAEASPAAAPPPVFAEAPVVDETPSRADELAGGLDAPSEPTPRVEPAPPVVPRAAPSERTPRAARPSPPRTLATRSAPPPSRSVEIAPPIERAVEQASPSLGDTLMEAIEALIPTMEVQEEAPKPIQKEPEPLADPYADETSASPAAGNPAHEAARVRARGWTPQPGDRFPVDERDLERWGSR